MNLPESIKAHIAEETGHTDQIGMSGSCIVLYEKYVLKIEDVTPYTAESIAAMDWFSHRIPAPKVIVHEIRDGKSYLLMSRTPGKMSCDPEFLDQPGILLSALAKGMRTLWDTETDGCPRDRTLPHLLAEARFRVENDLVDMDNVEPETFGEGGFRDPAALMVWLEENQVPSVPVLTHGDYCLPNIFLENGRFSGFVDTGDAGLGEKWRDIALCYRSLRSNMGGAYGGKVYNDFDPDSLFSALGIRPDWDQIRYHLLLDELF